VKGKKVFGGAAMVETHVQLQQCNALLKYHDNFDIVSRVPTILPISIRNGSFTQLSARLEQSV